jgi:hypothetical protein
MVTTAESPAPRKYDETANTIEASFNYIVATIKPVYYAFEPPAGTPRQTVRFAAQRVPILNGSAAADQLSLDRQGFELRRHETAVLDFYDREEVERAYYPEIESLLKQATGAVKVVIRPSGLLPLPGATRRKECLRICEDGPQRLHGEVRTAACSRSSTSCRGWRIAEASLCRDQRLAADSRTG